MSILPLSAQRRVIQRTRRTLLMVVEMMLMVVEMTITRRKMKMIIMRMMRWRRNQCRIDLSYGLL